MWKYVLEDWQDNTAMEITCHKSLGMGARSLKHCSGRRELTCKG